MITPEIINYIKQQLAAGVSREQISSTLKQNGWADVDLAQAFASLVPPSVPPVMAASTTINTPITANPISAQPTMRSGPVVHSHKLRNFLIFFIILVLVGAGGWWFFETNIKVTLPPLPVITETAPNQLAPITPVAEKMEELEVVRLPVPVEQNSSAIWNTIPKDPITKDDKDFLNKYVFGDTFTDAKSIPQGESKKILEKYKKLLVTFEQGTDKQYYQCSLAKGETCALSVLRDIAHLAALNSFVLYNDGKLSESVSYSQRIVKLGQMITANSDDFITNLVGWVVQKYGYTALLVTKNYPAFSKEQKQALIDALRKEDKDVFKINYKNRAEVIDSITDVNAKPSVVFYPEDEDLLKQYRDAIAKKYADGAHPEIWKPEEVKRWFLDSLKIELANINLPCGSPTQDSIVDIGFDENNTTDLNNYLGKMFYTTTAASLGNTNLKRCEVEGLINSL
jgi:hypothetical protein